MECPFDNDASRARLSAPFQYPSCRLGPPARRLPPLYVALEVHRYPCSVLCALCFVQFVIVASLDQIDSSLEVEDRVALALTRCGVSITCEMNLFSNNRSFLVACHPVTVPYHTIYSQTKQRLSRLPRDYHLQDGLPMSQCRSSQDARHPLTFTWCLQSTAIANPRERWTPFYAPLDAAAWFIPPV